MRTHWARWLVLSASLLSAAALRGEPAHARLLVPDVYATRNTPLTVTLLIPASEPVPDLEALTAHWSSADQHLQTRMQREKGNPASLVLDGQSYLEIHYIVEVPAALAGPTLLEVADPRFNGARALVSIQNARVATQLAQGLAAAPADEQVQAAQPIQPAALLSAEDRQTRATATVRHPLVPGVSAYEPVYFVFGARDGLDARFQVSFKYQPFDRGWAHPLGITFTTTSLWDLHSDSFPFRDSTYRPSLSWFQDPVRLTADGRLRLEAQVGFWEHESNGRGLTHLFSTGAPSDSRSLNVGFIRPTLTYTWKNGSSLSGSLKLYTYYDRAVENRDIDDYRGYGDLQLRYRSKYFLLSTLLRKGSRGHFAQVDLGVPFGAVLEPFGRDPDDVHGWLLFQYLSGYGETLLDYNRRIPEQVRVGFMIVP
jgi:outer membrane phospholipase A